MQLGIERNGIQKYGATSVAPRKKLTKSQIKIIKIVLEYAGYSFGFTIMLGAMYFLMIVLANAGY